MKGKFDLVEEIQNDDGTWSLIFDVDDELLGEMIVFAKQVARKIEAAIPCERIGVSVIGLEVPHAHIHLIPLHGMHDIDFGRPKLKLSQEEFEIIAQKISSNMA